MIVVKVKVKCAPKNVIIDLKKVVNWRDLVGEELKTSCNQVKLVSQMVLKIQLFHFNFHFATGSLSKLVVKMESRCHDMSVSSNLMPEAVVEEQPEEECKAK